MAFFWISILKVKIQINDIFLFPLLNFLLQKKQSE